MDIEVNRAGQVTRYNNVRAKVECGLLVFRDRRNDAICLLDGGTRNRALFKTGAEVPLNTAATVKKV